MNKYKKLLIIFMVFVIVLVPCVAYAEETTTTNASSFVTYTDGKSYEGLPDFPTYVTYQLSDGSTVYAKLNSYFLYYSDVECLYYLICSDADEGTIYIKNNKFYSTDTAINYYKDSSFTSVKSVAPSSSFITYRCGENATVWTQIGKSSGGIVSVAYTDKLLQASDNIYTDSSLTSVFTQPAVGPLMLGMSSATIVQKMMTEMVGLLPLVIGLVVLVTAFWKGYRMLRVALQGA